MAKAPSPLLGYNNNVRHKNRVFHIQTEDSGIKHPHIITHLFMDGGRILKSVKKSYADIVGSEGMSDLVRQMMKEQHKAMFIALRDGQFDHLVDTALIAPPPGAPRPDAVAAAASAQAAAPPGGGAAAAAAIAAEIEVDAPRTIADGTIPAPPPSTGAPATTREPSPLEPAAEAEGEAPLTLDIDALERAQNEPAARPAFRSNHDLPPPPANLFRKPDTGRYRNMPAAREEVVEPSRNVATPGNAAVGPRSGGGTPAPKPSSSPPAAARARPTPGYGTGGGGAGTPRPSPPSVGHPASASSTRAAAAPPPPVSVPAPSEGRYAPARPAAIFGQARPQQGSSIFGEDLISDKSLDEVILSYLAEDLESEKK